MTLEERIENAARRRFGATRPYLRDDVVVGAAWEAISAEAKGRWMAAASEAVREIVPELFDGTGWLAPMEPDKEMLYAGESALDSSNVCVCDEGRVFAAMRDSYLNRDKKE